MSSWSETRYVEIVFVFALLLEAPEVVALPAPYWWVLAPPVALVFAYWYPTPVYRLLVA